MINCQSNLLGQETLHLAEGYKKHIRNIGYKKLSRYKARSLGARFFFWGGGIEFSASILTFDAKTKNMTGIDTEPL